MFSSFQQKVFPTKIVFNMKDFQEEYWQFFFSIKNWKKKMKKKRKFTCQSGNGKREELFTVDILWLFLFSSFFPLLQASLRSRRHPTQLGCLFWTQKFQSLVREHVSMTRQACPTPFSTSFVHIRWWTRPLITNTTIQFSTSAIWCSRSSSLTSKFLSLLKGFGLWKILNC